jgi:hypothetical protein
MTQQLPSDFTFNGSAEVNPLYERIVVEAADSIYGFADLEIPLKVKLTGGSFTDNIELDFSQDTKDAISDVDSLKLTFEIINNIPAGVSLIVSVFDENDQIIMTIPTESNAIEKIEVTPPIMDANGDVIEASQVSEILELTGDDILTFVEGKNLEFLIEFQTAETSNEIVKLKYSDTITYRAMLEANFRFDN